MLGVKVTRSNGIMATKGAAERRPRVNKNCEIPRRVNYYEWIVIWEGQLTALLRAEGEDKSLVRGW